MANETVTLSIVANGIAKANADVESLRQQVKRLERAVKSLDTSRASRQMRRGKNETNEFSDALRRLIKQFLIFKAVVGAFKVMAIIGGIRLLIPLLSGLTGALTALVAPAGIFSGLLAGYPVAVFTAVTAFGALKFATAGVGEAMGVVMSGDASPEEMAAAMERLGPSATKLAQNLRFLRENVLEGEAGRTAQENLFSGLNRALETLMGSGALNLFIGAFQQIATIFGEFAERVANVLSSDEGLTALSRVLGGSVNILRSLSIMGSRMFNVLLLITQEAMPVFTDMFERGEGAVGRLLERVRRGVREGTITDFVERAVEAARRLGRFLSDVYHAFRNIFRIATEGGYSDRFITIFEDAAAGFRDFTESADGVERISAWFERSYVVFEAFVSLLDSVREGLGMLGGDNGASAFASLVEMLTAEGGGLTRFFEALSTMDMGQFANTLNNVLVAVSGLLEVFLSLDTQVFAVINLIAGAIIALVDGFQRLPEPAQQSVGYLLGMASVAKMLGPLFSLLTSAGLRVAGSFTKIKSAAETLYLRGLYLVDWLKTAWTWLGSRLGPVIQRILPALRNFGAFVLRIARWIPLLGKGLLALLGPVGLVIAAVLAIGAALVWLWNNSETFRDIVTRAFESVKNFVVGAWDAITDGLQSAFDWMRGAFESFTEWLTGSAFWEAMTSLGDLIGDAVGFVSGGFQSAAETVGGWFGGDVSGQRTQHLSGGKGGNLANTVGVHRSISAGIPGRQTITNATTGRWSGSDHHKGLALDITGPFLGAYQKQLHAMGGWSEFHGQGSGRHLHAVFAGVGAGAPAGSTGVAVSGGPSGDTAGNLMLGGMGAAISINGPLIGTVVANREIDVEQATMRALNRIVKERLERR